MSQVETTERTSNVAEAARDLLQARRGRPPLAAKKVTAQPAQPVKVAPVAVRPIKRLRLRELLAKDLPIWVQNTSAAIAKAHKMKAGTITLQVGVGNTMERVLIPAGSDPVCLSDQIDSESLSKCRDLFKCVDAGALTVLDPDKAEEYYQKNEDRRGVAQQKIANEINKVQEDVPVSAITATEVQVDPSVIEICQFLKHKIENMDDNEKVAKSLERLDENRGTYNAEDLGYLLNNGKFKQIKAWAQKELKALEQEEEVIA